MCLVPVLAKMSSPDCMCSNAYLIVGFPRNKSRSAICTVHDMTHLPNNLDTSHKYNIEQKSHSQKYKTWVILFTCFKIRKAEKVHLTLGYWCL